MNLILYLVKKVNYPCSVGLKGVRLSLTMPEAESKRALAQTTLESTVGSFYKYILSLLALVVMDRR